MVWCTVEKSHPVKITSDVTKLTLRIRSCSLSEPGWIFLMSCTPFGLQDIRKITRETVSRVMSFKMIIYLGHMLPCASSNLPGAGGPRKLLLGLASDGVYTASSVTGRAVVSYTAFSPLPFGGYFLLHYPGSHLHRTLSGILPCEARTFLTP